MVARAVGLASLFLLSGCVKKPVQIAPTVTTKAESKLPRNAMKVAHVLVALCDNEHQGIQKVPKLIGNGDDAAENLYWGATLGLKSFMVQTKDWVRVPLKSSFEEPILDRIVFRHRSTGAYLVADAYRGSEMKACIADFLRACAGHSLRSAKTDAGRVIYLGGSANLVGFVGHNGLMDAPVDPVTHVAGTGTRDAIIHACKSQKYFTGLLKDAGANPLILTTDLMAPEGYVVEAILAGWVKGESGAALRARAGVAYNRYQGCGLKGATRIFATSP